MKPTAKDVHEAMQSAPLDGLPFRQARAALRAIDGRVAELERDRAECLALLTGAAEASCGNATCTKSRGCWEHRRQALVLRLQAAPSKEPTT